MAEPMTDKPIPHSPRKPRRRVRLLAVGAGALATIYAAAATFMGLFQRSFLYHPAPAFIDPVSQGLAGAERATLEARDGTRLSGWWIAPKDPAKPVFLYFHGNADGLDRRAKRFRLMSADGSGILAMSYRGYGGSEGSPSEAALHADARAIYDDLARRVPSDRIVLFGESLGTGVAVELARQVKAKAVILDSPYFSVLRRAEASYPWLPVEWLLVDEFRSDLRMPEVDEPVLILHGAADDLIPPGDSADLAARGQAGKVKRILYPGEPHVVPYDRGPDRDVPAFLAGLMR
jgi:hypothetical protein